MNRVLTPQEKVLRFLKRTKKKNKKYSILSTIIVLTLIISYNLFFENDPVAVKSEGEPPLLTGTFVGDIMLGRHVEEVTDKKGQEYLFRNVRPYFETSDYVTGNFEHPVTKTDDYEEADKFIHLQTSADSVKTMKNLGFSVLNLANNHTMDYLEPGLEDSIETFNKTDMDFVGAGKNIEDAGEVSYQSINGITIATLGFTDAYVKGARATKNDGGVANADPTIFMPLISEAKRNADLVVVHMHWGQEYDAEASPRQVGLGHALSDAGADIVIGHHPHVLSTVEKYNDTVIFYSLGNFVFDQGWSRTRDSAVVQYKLSKDGMATFEITPLRIREATPSPVNSWLAREKIFRQLTKDTGESIVWKRQDGKLSFQVNHKKVIKETGR
ncbi:CapA family protein [Bacillus sp. E(2018)]|uniref:CapA family protein n=1 Tax=Bacillus sp. E(2018) TaxID=2502239 RepID=UPI0010F81ED8|nr:CapA family protein [Bacillus sp. E(2018)]